MTALTIPMHQVVDGRVCVSPITLTTEEVDACESPWEVVRLLNLRKHSAVTDVISQIRQGTPDLTNSVIGD